MLAASGGKRNGVRPSAYLSGRHTHHDSPLHQGATCDAASVHFSLTIKRIDLGFKLLYSPVHYYKGEQFSYPIFFIYFLKITTANSSGQYNYPGATVQFIIQGVGQSATPFPASAANTRHAGKLEHRPLRRRMRKTSDLGVERGQRN